MKSWADHCSSDEEDSIHDNDAHLAEEAADKLGVNDDAQDAAVPINSDEVVPNDQPPPPRTYDFPSQPPFTAFVGNLSYNIKDVPQFVEAVSSLAKERLEEPVNVLGGRIAYHRTDPSKHRGFGYVEVETLDQLKALMTLNDGQSKIAGRNVQLDTANHQNNNRRGSHQNNRGSFQRGDRASFSKDNAGGGGGGGFGDIDGSKFRGGKYNNSNRGGGGDNNKRRGSHRNSFNNIGGGDNNQSDPAKQQESSGPPAQRPSLKLAPRSKPVDADRSSTASNIFGGATARDEQAWQERRASMKKEEDTDKQPDAAAKTEDGDKAESGAGPAAKEKRPSHQDRRQSGRGLGGRGRGGRGGGRGDNDKGGDHQNKRGSRRNSQQQDKKQQKQQSPEEKAAAAMAAAAVPDAAPKKTEASNKFALLMDSDSE